MAYNNQLGSKLNTLVGEALSSFTKTKFRPGLERIKQIKFSEEYQGRIIDCMVGEVDDNYIETPETDIPIVKLEHSKEGLVKVPSIKGKTILVNADGNETDTPGEGCRLVSVGEDEDNKLIILSKNRNLFEGEVEQGFINQSTGENVNWVEYWRTKDYIQCKPQTIYNSNFVYKGITNISWTFFYDKNKNFISMARNNPCTTPKECYFIRLAGQAEHVTLTRIDMSELKDITLYEQNKSDTYVPPKHHKTEILLNEPLRKIDDTIYDEIIDNKMVRRTCKYIITENTSFNYDTELNDRVGFVVKKSNINNQKLGGKIISDKFTYVQDTGDKYNSDYCITLGRIPNYPIVFTLPKVILDINDEDNGSYPRIEKLKKWLKENPIEVIYELAEPIIEELPNGITLQGFDDTTMYIENSITPTVSYGYNALIPYKEELRTQKEEVETNTLDIENNIIPYLMDMEYNLMLMGEDI